MADMTLAEIAREIERRRKGTMPKSLMVEYDDEGKAILTICRWNDRGFTDGTMQIPDDLAHAILRDAMLMATEGARIRKREGGPGWEVFHDETGDPHEELDSDHGGCPTRSLFAAFCAVFAEAHE